MTGGVGAVGAVGGGERLPLLLSVPHAGLVIPEEAAPYCVLSPDDVAADGDVGAAEIYDLEHLVAAYQTTDVARAIVDLNRAEDDRRADGVVKTHTCWDVPVYEPFPPEDVVESMLARYHRPYHARLRAAAASPGVLLGVDCHTMAAIGPPVGPDPGATRPAVCLSDGAGTCPREWMEELARCFRAALAPALATVDTTVTAAAPDARAVQVTLNDPFRGGHVIRSHATELPWVQLEFSRAPILDDEGKRRVVAEALGRFCTLVFPAPPA